LVHRWSPRKEALFTDEHIHTAWTALRERGFAAEAAAV